MIRLVVLGSGAALPSKKHLPSCIAFRYSGTFLLECCEGTQRQMMKYNIGYGAVKAIFLSHLHADCFLGIFGLIQSLNLNGRAEPLHIFGVKGTKKFLEQALALRELLPAFPVQVVDAKPDEIVWEEKEFFVKAIPVKHLAPALGYVIEEKEKIKFDEKKAKGRGLKGRMFSEIMEKGKITVGGKTVKLEEVTFKEKGKKIVFSGDTSPCESVLRESEGADLLIHDACFVEEHERLGEERGHSTAKQAAEVAKKAGAKKLLLTHISNRYENDRKPLLEEAKKVFKESTLAEEGMELLI